jgi:hypothetical protein
MSLTSDLLKQEYQNWLSQIKINDLTNDWVEIQTPFTDIKGDIISLFAKANGNKYCITDYGVTFDELQMCNLLSKTRKTILEKILRNQDCYLDGEHIKIDFYDIKDFVKTQHKIIQAIISANDLFIFNEKQVKELFLFDVMEFFDKNNISYSSRSYYISDCNDFQTSFNFNIGKRKNAPALHTKVVNRIDESRSKLILYEHKNINLGKNEKILIIVNDNENFDKKTKINIEKLKKNGAEILEWSEREKYFSPYMVA